MSTMISIRKLDVAAVAILLTVGGIGFLSSKSQQPTSSVDEAQDSVIEASVEPDEAQHNAYYDLQNRDKSRIELEISSLRSKYGI